MPTKQLFVLRHAKSSWEDPGLDDHERPLAPRGRRAAQALRRHLREQEIRPTLVLCSSARRTKETLDGIGLEGQQLIEPDLYAASADALIERLKRVPDDVDSVMVIGHNPAMQMLVLRLVGANDRHPSGANIETVQRKFPTAALASLDLVCGWRELAPGCAKLSGLVRPKDLH